MSLRLVPASLVPISLRLVPMSLVPFSLRLLLAQRHILPTATSATPGCKVQCPMLDFPDGDLPNVRFAVILNCTSLPTLMTTTRHANAVYTTTKGADLTPRCMAYNTTQPLHPLLYPPLSDDNMTPLHIRPAANLPSEQPAIVTSYPRRAFASATWQQGPRTLHNATMHLYDGRPGHYLMNTTCTPYTAPLALLLQHKHTTVKKHAHHANTQAVAPCTLKPRSTTNHTKQIARQTYQPPKSLNQPSPLLSQARKLY